MYEPQINLLVHILCHSALRSLGESGMSVHAILHSQEPGGRGWDRHTVTVQRGCLYTRAEVTSVTVQQRLSEVVISMCPIVHVSDACDFQ